MPSLRPTGSLHLRSPSNQRKQAELHYRSLPPPDPNAELQFGRCDFADLHHKPRQAWPDPPGRLPNPEKRVSPSPTRAPGLLAPGAGHFLPTTTHFLAFPALSLPLINFSPRPPTTTPTPPPTSYDSTTLLLTVVAVASGIPFLLFPPTQPTTYLGGSLFLPPRWDSLLPFSTSLLDTGSWVSFIPPPTLLTMAARPNRSNQQPPQASALSSRQNEYFVPRDGIDREVITADICRYLGNDALVRPGTYEVCKLSPLPPRPAQ